MSSSVVRLGLLGCGNVGASLAQMIASNGDAIAERAGVRLEITQIAVRDVAKDRGLPANSASITDDPSSVVAASDVDLVVEVMGGIEPARTLILAALAAGKPVVTANKALLAAAGAELFAAAEA
ncbi:MAG: homoserine dehydrogenase, partial [Acidimicrobiia bacterium]|nr:homoserine dehydrogenase [Acidimicrobiia bacterium]